MARAELSLERIRHLTRHNHRGKPTGVHVLFAWRENCVNSKGLDTFQVLAEVSGIGGQIFGGVELFGVDENRDDDDIALAFGLADEGEMAFVQHAHRRNQAYGTPSCVRLARKAVSFRNGLDHTHPLPVDEFCNNPARRASPMF